MGLGIAGERFRKNVVNTGDVLPMMWAWKQPPT